MGYQPELTAKLLESLKNSREININEPRKSVGRFLAIKKHILENYRQEELKKFNLIDVGCNDGFFTNAMAHCTDITCLGIDNNNIYDAGHVSEMPLTIALKTSNSLKISHSYFYQADVIDFFEANEEIYDFSLVLSVMHNLMLCDTFRKNRKVTLQDMESCFKKIWDNTSKIMYFETDTCVGNSYGWGEKDLVDNIRRICTNCEITQISETPAYNGSRKLFAIKKTTNAIKKNRTYKGKYLNGSGTEKLYIELNEEKIKKYFNLHNIYKGSLNIKTNMPICLNNDFFDIEINYANKKYKADKCFVNEIEGFIVQTGWDKTICEFFTDKHIDVENGITLEFK